MSSIQPSDNTLVIFGAGTSRTLRVHWAAAELELNYECRAIGARTGETQTASYLALNPKGKVPLLVHGDLVLSESAAIIRYLSEQFDPPNAFHVPRSPPEKAKLDEWCYAIMCELDAHPLYIIRRHEALEHIYGPAPSAVTSARAYCSKQLHALAKKWAASAPFLLEPGFSIADILMWTCLDWAVRYDIALPSDFEAYHRRVGTRQALITAEQANQLEQNS